MWAAALNIIALLLGMLDRYYQKKGKRSYSDDNKRFKEAVANDNDDHPSYLLARRVFMAKERRHRTKGQRGNK